MCIPTYKRQNPLLLWLVLNQEIGSSHNFPWERNTIPSHKCPGTKVKAFEEMKTFQQLANYS